jgi:hypothetical protein
MVEDKLPTIASLALLFIAGAVLGRLHEKSGETAIGDRVMCGLLSLPLIALGVYYALPQRSLLWALAAPVPVLIYTLLLAREEKPIISKFTRNLLIGVGFTYVLMLLAVLLSGPGLAH